MGVGEVGKAGRGARCEAVGGGLWQAVVEVAVTAPSGPLVPYGPKWPGLSFSRQRK